jgi:hypothetical protein
MARILTHAIYTAGDREYSLYTLYASAREQSTDDPIYEKMAWSKDLAKKHATRALRVYTPRPCKKRLKKTGNSFPIFHSR